MAGIRYYTRDGSEITMEQWVALLGDLPYRRVAFTTLGEVTVSTVWLGMDHHISFSEPEPDFPVAIFETMAFGPGEFSELQWRYGSEAAALDGHAKVVEMVRLAHQLEMPDAVVHRPVREG